MAYDPPDLLGILAPSEDRTSHLRRHRGPIIEMVDPSFPRLVARAMVLAVQPCGQRRRDGVPAHCPGVSKKSCGRITSLLRDGDLILHDRLRRSLATCFWKPKRRTRFLERSHWWDLFRLFRSLRRKEFISSTNWARRRFVALAAKFQKAGGSTLSDGLSWAPSPAVTDQRAQFCVGEKKKKTKNGFVSSGK